MGNSILALNEVLKSRFPAEKLVFGDGSVAAKVVLIGEAPGEKEVEQGKPFVGKAGKNLDEFLSISGIDRGQLYVTNAVKLRPCKEGKSGRMVNRAPTKEEIETFRPFLLQEIALISPAVVVTLGNTPLFAVTGEKLSIGDCHGKMLTWNGISLFPMYHPASVIYNRSLRDIYIEDTKRLGEIIIGHA